MSIPVISPIDLTVSLKPKLLSAPDTAIEDADYTVHEADPISEPAAEAPPLPDDPFDEMEMAADTEVYHDPAWWRERLAAVRQRLSAEASPNSTLE